MGRILLTGLTKNKHHEFKLEYEIQNGTEHCIVYCKCGWRGEIKYFHNYAGVKELERLWDAHSKRKNSSKLP
jgi:hypothetical protein